MSTATIGTTKRRCTLVELVGHEQPSKPANLLQSLVNCFDSVTALATQREGCQVPQNVPELWWQSACEQNHMPLACVDSDNNFVWVNGAFERMVGYSAAELRGKSWMSITDQLDVGGDYASKEALKDGSMTSYSISKCYRHKHGHKVPVSLSVWRFPLNGIDELRCFISEAAPEIISKTQVEQMKSDIEGQYQDLLCRIAAIDKEKVEVNVGDHWRDGDNVRGDKNSDKQIKFLAGALCVLAIAMVWGFYYLSTLNKPVVVPQAPTTIENPIK